MENSPFDVVNPQTGEITTTQNMNSLIKGLDSFIEAIDKGEATPKYNANPVYWEPRKAGEKMKGVFLGFVVLTKNEADGKKQIPTATWLSKDEQGIYTNYMHSGVSAISNFRNLVPQQNFVITFDKKEGKTLKFSVVTY